MNNIVGAELDEKYQCKIHQGDELLLALPFHECHTSSPTSKFTACILPHISSFDEYYEVEKNILILVRRQDLFC